MIEAENVFKAYNGGKVKVLNGASLTIENGSFSVLLGASGSGKSTLMSIISGLERADSGKVACDGVELTALDDKQLTQFRKEKIGFVFQQYYLLPHLSVEANVRLSAELAGNKGYPEIIEAVGLKDKLKRRPSELSGGEQQRACIARALAKNPEYLFMDEPTGALDEATGREILDYIAKLKSELGFTIIMVTHNANVAEMADVVFTMRDGKVSEPKLNAIKKSAFEIDW